MCDKEVFLFGYTFDCMFEVVKCEVGSSVLVSTVGFDLAGLVYIEGGLFDHIGEVHHI